MSKRSILSNPKKKKVSGFVIGERNGGFKDAYALGEESGSMQIAEKENDFPGDEFDVDDDRMEESKEFVTKLSFSDDEYLDSDSDSDSATGSDDDSFNYKNMERKSMAEDVRNSMLQKLGEFENDSYGHEKETASDMEENRDEEEEEEGAVEGKLFGLSALKERISKTLGILSNFSSLRNAKISRKEYVAEFLKDLSNYYGYCDYLLELLFPLFPAAEFIEFLEASDVPRPTTLRTNTLKTKRRDLAQCLIRRGVNVDPLEEWSKVGLRVIESTVPIGATPEYLAGHYMLQAAASFLPVISLGPRVNEKILDMCAAPGGKTTYIAQLMRNTGFLFANDISLERMRATAANIHRLGIRNTVVSVADGRKFSSYMKGFDRILLDAPCSGTGVISKDPSVKISKTAVDFGTLTRVQKELILAAIDMLEPSGCGGKGGVVVYSTCSVCVEENEQVVQYALNKRPNVVLVDAGLPIGDQGFTSYCGLKFSSSMQHARRFYPHKHNLDGFFVAKLRKISHFKPAPKNR